jgi:hypothetical protein
MKRSRLSKKDLQDCRMTLFAELDRLNPPQRRELVEAIVEWFNEKELEES